MNRNIVDRSKNVVIGTGNRVIQRITEAYYGLGKKQFLTLCAASILIVFIIVALAIRQSQKQEHVVVSIREIEQELDDVLQTNLSLQKTLGNQRRELIGAVEEGMRAFQDEDFSLAVEKLSAVADKIPLASVHNNLGIAYEKMGLSSRANESFKNAEQTAVRRPADLTDIKERTPNLSSDSADSFRLIEDFFDPNLGPKWRVSEPDLNRWKMESGHLLLITQRGSIRNNATSLRNKFQRVETLPTRDYELIAKITMTTPRPGNSVSIAIMENDDNYVEVGYEGVSYYQNSPFFAKEVNGNRRIRSSTHHETETEREVIFLKLRREGVDYHGSYAFNEAAVLENTEPAEQFLDSLSWTEIGTQAWLANRPRLAIWANNEPANSTTAVPEIGVYVDFVIVRLR